MENKSALEYAYGIALQSYGWMIDRVNAQDQGLRATMTFGTTLNTGIVVLIIQKTTPSFSSFIQPAFAFALLFFLIATIRAFVGLHWSGIVLLDPKILCDQWLNVTPEDFLKHSIRDAGENFDLNAKHVQYKFRRNIESMSFYVLALLLFIVWSHCLPRI